MSEPLFMGIDGGGSTLRVAIVNAELETLNALRAGAVNPSVIGRAEAAKRIQAGIRDALNRSALPSERIAAAGIGVAGASNLHSEDWLLEVMRPLLPASRLAASSDLEIALVGALAQPQGILLLAGTGSAALGIKPDGKRLQTGGWGYLLGDEGSGFWIGARLLRHVIRLHDGGAQGEAAALSRACLNALDLSEPGELIAWVYRSGMAPSLRVGSLAPFVLERAEAGDEIALDILRCAAMHLSRQVEILRSSLAYAEAPIAFAGGLLDKDNWLSRELARRLGLARRPVAKYPPVIGAALLAKLKWRAAEAV